MKNSVGQTDIQVRFVSRRQRDENKDDECSLRILYLPSWYPYPDHPTDAIFMQVQAHALARVHRVLVVPPPSTFSLFSFPRGWFDRCQFLRGPGNFYEMRLSGPNYTPGFPGSYERILWRLYCRSFREATRFFGAPPDLIHAHSVEAGYFGARLADTYGCPLVLTEHLNRPAVALKTSKDRHRFKYTMEVAKSILAVSPMQRDLLYKAGVRKPIEVLPNLIDADFFCPGSFAQPAPPYRLIVVGNLIPRKGISYLLDAFAHLRSQWNLPLELEVVGKGPLKLDLERKTQSLDLAHHVRFHGEKGQRAIRDLLRQCHIYVSSSLTESFGVAVLEAMSVGLPVVVTRSGGPESYVTRAQGELVEPASCLELARGIQNTISRLAEFSPHRQHQYVVDHFSAPVVVKQITRQYSAALRRVSQGVSS